MLHVLCFGFQFCSGTVKACASPAPLFLHVFLLCNFDAVPVRIVRYVKVTHAHGMLVSGRHTPLCTSFDFGELSSMHAVCILSYLSCAAQVAQGMHCQKLTQHSHYKMAIWCFV